jgi:DNA-binding NtrC family response regulator
VVFADESVSREHGLLTCEPDGFWVYRDRGSTNGSFLADQLESQEEVEEVRRLAPGRSHRVAAGQAVVMGNRAGRICLLAEPAKSDEDDRPRKSGPTLQLDADIGRNARHRSPVFLLGPTGSGKTWAARQIHRQSKATGNFVLVDCASLPRDLNSLRSELLGHVKGAFSGATQARLGKIHHAREGTLFLDEVESLSVEGQGLLLNLIDGTGDFTPLGANADEGADVPRFRLISASKVPLRQSGLREDLCNRLARGGIVLLPTLEERRADIPLLVNQFVATLNQELQLDARVEPAAIKLLQAADWPGHVRELEGVVRTVIELEHADRAEDALTETSAFQRVDGKIVPVGRPRPLIIGVAAVKRHLQQHQRALGVPHTSDLPSSMPSTHLSSKKRPKDYTVEDLRTALSHHSNNITRTAKALGMVPNTLKSLLEKHSLR